MAHGLCCSAAGRIFLDQGSNPCVLNWQADSLPLMNKGRSSLTCVVSACGMSVQCEHQLRVSVVNDLTSQNSDTLLVQMGLKVIPVPQRLAVRIK